MASIKLHRNPPFRAEHLGSLLRTEKLLDTRHAWEAKKASEKDLQSVEDKDIKDVVQDQVSVGFRAITDGEYRRHMVWFKTMNLSRLTIHAVLGVFLARS
jgi:methionine synthase II (cobalamin-independent)